MRKILLGTAAIIIIISAAEVFTGSANALTQSAPSALREAADSTNLAQDVRWVCRHHWNGRRSCWWEPSRRGRHWRRHW
jgi:hypothetical protein